MGILSILSLVAKTDVFISMYIHTTMQKNIIMGLLTLVAIFLILATTNTNAETGTDISTGSKDRFKA
jgi:hypothetical protein